MAGHEITIEREVAASPEAVWRVLTDVEHAADTLRGVTRVEVLTEGPYDVGTRWRETRTMMGKQETQEMYVTHVQAPARTTVEADAGGVHYVTTFTVAARAGGSHVVMTFAGEQAAPSTVQKVTWAVLGRVGMKMARKVMVQDLEDIAARAESGA